MTVLLPIKEFYNILFLQPKTIAFLFNASFLIRFANFQMPLFIFVVFVNKTMSKIVYLFGLRVFCQNIWGTSGNDHKLLHRQIWPLAGSLLRSFMAENESIFYGLDINILFMTLAFLAITFPSSWVPLYLASQNKILDFTRVENWLLPKSKKKSMQ